MYKNEIETALTEMNYYGFNPCFNGSMYKNIHFTFLGHQYRIVSILVLMDLCIKTLAVFILLIFYFKFQSLF